MKLLYQMHEITRSMDDSISRRYRVFRVYSDNHSEIFFHKRPITKRQMAVCAHARTQSYQYQPSTACPTCGR